MQNKIKLIRRDFKNEVPHIYCVIIKGLKKRELLIKNILRSKIQLGIHYLPGYKLQFFRKNKKFFPNTEKIFDKVITLPLHPDLNFSKIDYIIKILTSELNKKIYF